MYRILDGEKEIRERRNQLRHPDYKKPELLATAPNQVWSWDITKLKGPQKWTYFYLYVIIDIFSRCVVGWMVASRENASLAVRLISETCERQGIEKDQLTIHADRGSPMKAKLMVQLLADLGIVKSHSRPYVSDDNPFSESQFKTLKYRPEFPDNFGSQEDARIFLTTFFDWYDNEHRHSGINMMTPAAVHYGEAKEILEHRRNVMLQAFEAHPERFVKGTPVLKDMPEAVWINPPKKEDIRKNEDDPVVMISGPVVEKHLLCYNNLPGETEAGSAGRQPVEG
jgi:putative transposase